MINEIQFFLDRFREQNSEFYKDIDFDKKVLYNISEEELSLLIDIYSLSMISKHKLSFSLKDVYLYYEGHNYLLGNYTFIIESNGVLSCNEFRPNFSILKRKDYYKHLYINSYSCCLGAYDSLIKNTLFFGNLSELFILIRTWLSYDGESGYINIEDFLFNDHCPICKRKLNENGGCDKGCNFNSSFIDLNSLEIKYCCNCDEPLDDNDECQSCSRCYKCGELLDDDEICPSCDRCYECDRILNDDGYCPNCNYCHECDALLDDGECPNCNHCDKCGHHLNDDGYCNDCDYCSDCHELEDDCTCEDEKDNEEIEEDSNENNNIIDYGIDDGSQLKLTL